MPDNKKHGKHHVRTLGELDRDGRTISTHTVYDLDAMLLEHFPELRKDHEKQQQVKKKGQVLPLLPE